MALSILHRITGVGLGLGAIWLVLWLYLAAKGGPAFEALRWFNSSILGILLLIGFAFALYFHLCNGIRHLLWDAGYGFAIKTANSSSWVVLIAAGVLTVVSVIAGLKVAF